MDCSTDQFQALKQVFEWLKLGVPARNMFNLLPLKFESFRMLLPCPLESLTLMEDNLFHSKLFQVPEFPLTTA